MYDYGIVSSKAVRTMREYGIDDMIAHADAVIVGFSGGADSVLLLSFLKDYLDNTKIKLCAAHLNHLIRGEEAYLDEEFCRNFCIESDVEFVSERVDVPALSEKLGCGIEEAARRARYDFFDRVAKEISEHGNVLIATAHNADDNLETVLFNMLRGAGTLGLAGIPPVRDGKYVRPFISVSSCEIRQYLNEHGIGFRVDSTNADTDYTRNYIRQEIIPKLRHVSPNPENTVSRMSAILRADNDFIENEAESIVSNGEASVAVEVLKSAHIAVASRIVRILYERTADFSSSLSQTNIADVLKLVSTAANGAKISLPGKIDAVIDGGSLRFVSDESEKTYPPFSRNAVMGENLFEEHGFSVFLTEENENIHKREENIYKLSIHKSFRFDTIKGQVVIRSRKPGDTYTYGGINRKVKKLLCDAHIPQKERDCIPLICDDVGVLWIPGFPPRDGCGVNKAYDGKILTVNYSKLGILETGK